MQRLLKFESGSYFVRFAALVGNNFESLSAVRINFDCVPTKYIHF